MCTTAYPLGDEIGPPKNYCESPIYSNESDADLSDDDPSYSNRPRSRLGGAVRVSASSSSSSSDTTDSDPENVNAFVVEGPKKSRKRLRNTNKWKQIVAKTLRNTGKEYVSNTKSNKIVPARSIKDPCTSKFRIKCVDNINEIDRNLLFQKYWALGNLELQRSFIRNCMVEPNNAFYFIVNDTKIRVCKTFFINTLGICDRQIRTVKKKTNAQGFIEKDNRGKNQNKKRIEPATIQDIKNHINCIPRIESHYLRSSTSREYIGEEKTIMDLWRDFDKDQRDAGKATCEYWLYYDIFTKEFNIGFFQPKKDRCDLCFEYELASPEKKTTTKRKI
uniref:SFRICE_014553 n=1 Tax=Spodoptera frugiperda TaxID=7108 RepID=A0A2H1VPJ8_SPOFR